MCISIYEIEFVLNISSHFVPINLPLFDSLQLPPLEFAC